MENLTLKMILCDVDGTLIPKGFDTVSNDTFSAIRQATENGVRFVIASGRCYRDLKKLFAPVFDIVSFICSDGALAIENDTVLYRSPIDKSLISRIFTYVNLSGNESLVLYGEKQNYCLGENVNLDETSHLTSTDEIDCEIYKMAFLNISDQKRQKVKTIALNSGKLSMIYSDALWIEFVSLDTDKGHASSALQSKWSITPFETAAFGDNTNDFGMLRRARLTYASPNAIADIKRMCKYSTENVNNEILNIIRQKGI